MAVTVEEQFGSVRWSDDNAVDITFIIRGAANAAEAHTELLAKIANTSYNGIPFQGSSLEEINENNGDWYGIGHFGFSRPSRRTGTDPVSDPYADTLNFETHVEDRREFFFDGNGTAAWNDPNRLPAIYVDTSGNPVTGPPPRPPTQLGYKGQGEAHEGLTLLRPTSSFSFDFYPATNIVNDKYLQNVSKSVGSINSQIFKAYAIGEVMFASARGSHTRTDGWRFNFQFLVKPNRTAMAVAPGITVPSAKGWDIVEVYYDKSVEQDPTGEDIVTEIPVQAVLWQPHELVDFNTILFPNTAPT